MDPVFVRSGGSLGCSWASWSCLWGPQERHKCDSPMRKPFVKIYFFASCSSCCPSGAHVGASWAALRPKRAPKIAPKVAQKLCQISLKTEPIFISFCTNFGFILGSQNGVIRGTCFSKFFEVAPAQPIWGLFSRSWPLDLRLFS